MAGTRLKFPRLGAALDVTVEAEGTQWRGRIVDLSPDAVKIRWHAEAAQLQPGTDVRLQFALRDREFPFWVAASVARMSPESAVLWFVDLEDQQFQRLKDLLESLLHREWQQVVDELVTLAPSGRAEPQRTSAPSPEPPRPADRSPEPAEQASETAPAEASPSESTGPEEARLRELLAQAGLTSLRFPGSGVLSPQWREFLSGLRPKQSPPGAPTDKKWSRRRSTDTGSSKA